MVAIVQRLEHRVVVPVMRVRFPLATHLAFDVQKAGKFSEDCLFFVGF